MGKKISSNLKKQSVSGLVVDIDVPWLHPSHILYMFRQLTFFIS